MKIVHVLAIKRGSSNKTKIHYYIHKQNLRVIKKRNCNGDECLNLPWPNKDNGLAMVTPRGKGTSSTITTSVPTAQTNYHFFLYKFHTNEYIHTYTYISMCVCVFYRLKACKQTKYSLSLSLVWQFF